MLEFERCDGCDCYEPCAQALERMPKKVYYSVTECTPDKAKKTIDLMKQRPGKHECIEARQVQGGYSYYVYRNIDQNRHISGYEMIVVRPKSD